MYEIAKKIGPILVCVIWWRSFGGSILVEDNFPYMGVRKEVSQKNFLFRNSPPEGAIVACRYEIGVQKEVRKGVPKKNLVQESTTRGRHHGLTI